MLLASFLWEGLVAVGTLVLASFTGWLAWVTRRLARTTALEVQSQFRPILVPAEGSFSATWPGADRNYEIQMRLRNIGAGPALGLRFALGGGDWTGAQALVSFGGLVRSPEISVVAPNDEIDVTLGASMDFFTGTGPAPTTPVRVIYSDMAGRLFATDVDWVIWKWLSQGETPRRVRSVTVHDGVTPRYVSAPGWSSDALELSRTSRPRWSWSAWRGYLFPYPGVEPQPLWRRLVKTWGAMRPRRTQVFSQRVQWGARAFNATLDKPVPEKLPVELARLYRMARGLRYGFRAYWRIR